MSGSVSGQGVLVCGGYVSFVRLGECMAVCGV